MKRLLRQVLANIYIVIIIKYLRDAYLATRWYLKSTHQCRTLPFFICTIRYILKYIYIFNNKYINEIDKKILL